MGIVLKRYLAIQPVGLEANIKERYVSVRYQIVFLFSV